MTATKRRGGGVGGRRSAPYIIMCILLLTPGRDRGPPKTRVRVECRLLSLMKEWRRPTRATSGATSRHTSGL